MNNNQYVFYCILFFVFFTSCNPNARLRKETSLEIKKYGFYETYSQKLGYELNGSENKKFIETVNAWLGVPYKYGGCAKDGTDCSCFVSSFYNDVFGISLPRKSEDMKLLTKIIDSKKDTLLQGDLVFFKIKGEKISHVGIYISKGYFVHATTAKGVMINNLDEIYYKKYYLTAGRVER